jgi:hypothetical protein
MAGLFMNISFKVVASLMSLWGVAWLACMQNVGTLMILGECSTRCHLETCGDLNCHDIGTCEMQKALELFNKCNKKVCTQTPLLFWGAECMSQCSCP